MHALSYPQISGRTWQLAAAFFRQKGEQAPGALDIDRGLRGVSRAAYMARVSGGEGRRPSQ
jgi:hypothetical protein